MPSEFEGRMAFVIRLCGVVRGRVKYKIGATDNKIGTEINSHEVLGRCSVVQRSRKKCFWSWCAKRFLYRVSFLYEFLQVSGRLRAFSLIDFFDLIFFAF